MREKWNAIIDNMKQEPKVFFLFIILRILVIMTMIAQIYNHNYENVFLCILTLILFIVPSTLELTMKINFPETMEIIILLFIFSSEILGEINSFYLLVPFWDTILHTINGFLIAAIGFSLVDLLNRKERFMFQLSPAFLAITAFCFSMTIGITWEFFEFFMDMFLGTDMQKDTVVHIINTVSLNPDNLNIITRIPNIQSVVVNGKDLGLNGYLDIGLIDTMQDLFVNFVGAIVFSFIGYWYVKRRGQGNFARRFIPEILTEEREI
jgi:hypothetical protein